MLFVLLCACPLFALIFIFAHPLLRLWLGDGFNTQIAIAARILIIGWTANILASPDYFTFLGIGRVRKIVIATWLRSAANVIPILLLVILGNDFALSIVVGVMSASLIVDAVYMKWKYFHYWRSHKAGHGADLTEYEQLLSDERGEKC